MKNKVEYRHGPKLCIEPSTECTLVTEVLLLTLSL